MPRTTRSTKADPNGHIASPTDPDRVASGGDGVQGGSASATAAAETTETPDSPENMASNFNEDWRKNPKQPPPIGHNQPTPPAVQRQMLRGIIDNFLQQAGRYAPTAAGRVAGGALVGSLIATELGADRGPVDVFFDKAVTLRDSMIPHSWGAGQATNSGIGVRFQDPSNPGNSVRIDMGRPNSPLPSQQVDHVVVNRDGRIIDRSGAPIGGPLSANPAAHIPAGDDSGWSSWNRP